MNQKTALLYLPVLHQGYLDFLARNQIEVVKLLGPNLVADFPQLKKDLRSLKPTAMRLALAALRPELTVEIVEAEDLVELNRSETGLVIPDDEVVQQLVQQYLPQAQYAVDTVFLRWDRSKSLAEQQIETAAVISESEFDREVMAQALTAAHHSSDWWRQVGAAIVKAGKVLEVTFNRHLPDQQQPYFDGDARAEFHRGEHIDKTTAIHAEASAIAQAAKKGESLAGAEIYVTTFPCPTCAKLVAASGIKKLYFQDGYGMLNSESILKDQGVEIIRVVRSQT